MIDTRTFRVKVINAQEMFKTSGAAELDISYFDASNVTDVGLMFNGMTELSSLTLGNIFDARKVTNMTSSLGYLGSLKTIDLTGVKLRDVIDMSRLFNGSKLEQITFGTDIDTSKVTNMYNLFNRCSKLSNLRLDNFTFNENVSLGSFLTGLADDINIYVKSDTEKTFISSNTSINSAKIIVAGT